MKFNWHPDRVAFLDFEVQSECELNESTVHKYARHPSTRALTCVVKVDGNMYRMGPYLGQGDLQLLTSIASENVLVAHNAPFDGAIWEQTLGLPEATWFDTLKAARVAGLPGPLDKLGTVLTGRGKDPNGARLIQMLCIIKNRRVPVVGPAHQLLLDYNARDVELLESIYGEVHGCVEPEVMDVDYAVNERGIPVCRARLEKVSELAFKFSARAKENFKDTTGVIPTSGKQVLGWLKTKGFSVEAVNKNALDAMFKDPDKYFVEEDTPLGVALAEVREALVMRKEAVSVSLGKSLAAISVLDPDDRMREQMVYWGAHTGRWSARRFQVHNLPSVVGRGIDVKHMEPEEDAIVALAAKESDVARMIVTPSNVCGVMLRTVVQADNLLVADYSSVEVRGTAWVFDQQRMLQLFQDPKQSLYMDMAARIFGRQIDKQKDFDYYQLAKAVILGCGYGMSGAKFQAQLATRDINKAPLEEAGLTPAALVKMYREAYPEIPAGWRLLHNAIQLAVNGCPNEAGKCKFYMERGHLMMELPSGRRLTYRNARLEMLVPAYCALYGMPEKPVPTVVYDSPRGFRGFLYGAKVCENAVQALCRDFTAGALVKCEQAGLNPVLHIHDEIVCEAGSDRLEEFMCIMSEQPAWAKGFPLIAEGYSGRVWSKQPTGYRQMVAMNGRILH